MADTYKRLTSAGLQLGVAVATLYTAPAGNGVVIRNIRVVNNDTVARTFALYLGGTTAAHLITPAAVMVPAGGSWEDDSVHCMSSGEVLSGIGSVASMLNFRASGDET